MECTELLEGAEAMRISRKEATQTGQRMSLQQLMLERHDLEAEDVGGTATKGSTPKRSEILPLLVVVAPSTRYSGFRQWLQCWNKQRIVVPNVVVSITNNMDILVAVA